MWMLPKVEKSEAQEFPLLDTSTYGITHYKVTLHVYDGEDFSPKLNEDQLWVSVAELSNYPMPSPYRKIVNKLLLCLL